MILRRLSQMGEDRHCADERHGGIAAPKCRQNMGRGAQGSSRAAVTRGHGALKKSGLMNGANAGPGKLTGLIRIRCGFGKGAHSGVKCGGIVRHADNGFLEVERRDHPLRAWMIPVLEEEVGRSDGVAGLP